MSYIKPHSDKRFTVGFMRYFIAKDIVESDSPDAFKKKLRRLFDGKEEEEAGWHLSLWKETKLSNLCILVDYALSEYCGYAFSNSLFTDNNGAKSYVLEKIKRKNRLKANEDAMQKLNEEIGTDEASTYSPHTLMLVAGFGLGVFIDFMRGHIINFDGKEDFINKLSRFNELRDLVTHNRCSSRIELETVIDDALIAGKDILKTIASFKKADDLFGDDEQS